MRAFSSGHSVVGSSPRCTPSASTSYATPVPSRCVAVRAKDEAFCRDKVSAPKQAATSQGKTYKVTFLGAGGQARVIDCPDNQYILDAAEAQGLDLPATCRGGICGACVARVAKGKVDQSDIDDLSFTVNEEEQAQGMTLICMARACSDLDIETQSDWGYSLGIGAWPGATGKFTSKPEALVGEEWRNS